MKYLCVALIAVTGLYAEETSKLTARELFYREDGTAAAGPAKIKPKTEPSANKPHTPAQQQPRKASEPVAFNRTTPSGVPVVNAAMHLGVRYNVLQIVDRSAKKRVPVDPDKNFRAGDCVAIELAPNRSGYIYVFNRGTTGAWQPLIPSPDAAGEQNRVLNGQSMTIPSSYCFEFDHNAGTEKLLVVLTESEEDARRLSEAMKQSEPKPATPPAQGQVMLAGGRLTQQIEMMRTSQLIGRDIKLAKIGTSTQDEEPPNSVYAVKTSAGSNDRLIIEIALRHD